MAQQSMVKVNQVVRVPDGQHQRVSKILIKDHGKEISIIIINGVPVTESVKLPKCHRLDNPRDLNFSRKAKDTIKKILEEERRVK